MTSARAKHLSTDQIWGSRASGACLDQNSDVKCRENQHVGFPSKLYENHQADQTFSSVVTKLRFCIRMPGLDAWAWPLTPGPWHCRVWHATVMVQEAAFLCSSSESWKVFQAPSLSHDPPIPVEGIYVFNLLSHSNWSFLIKITSKHWWLMKKTEGRNNTLI